MKCSVCNKDLTKKEELIASVNDKMICDSCWSSEHKLKMSKEKAEELINAIPSIHRNDKDIFGSFFSKVHNIPISNAIKVNIICCGRSGSYKTTTAYGYLKALWLEGFLAKMISFNECLRDVDGVSRYPGYLVIDDVYVSSPNVELFNIIEYRLLNDFGTYITTQVIDLNSFGERVYSRLKNNYQVIKLK